MSSTNHLPTTNDCESISELVADYAFGLTNADETRRVESNLARCPDAEIQLQEFRRMQDELRESVRQVAPPVNLREKLLAAAVTTPAPAAAPSVSVMKPKPRTIQLSPAWLAAAAALVLLLLTNVYWLGHTAALNESIENIAGNGGPSAPFILTSTSGLRWARLPAANETENAAAFVMWNADSQIGLMYAVNMPNLQAGRVYELWLTRDGTRSSVGTFMVDDTGEGALLFHSSDPIDNYAWAWITEEPATGSEQPSEAIIAKGEL